MTTTFISQGQPLMSVGYRPVGAIGGMNSLATEPRKVRYTYPGCCSCTAWPIWIWLLTTTLLSLVLILIMQQLNIGRVVKSMAQDETPFKTPFTVVIGNSLATNSATKCVEVPKGVHCPNDVQQQGRGQWPDIFHIYHDGLGKVCVHRVDHEGAWGLNLSLQCQIQQTSFETKDQVFIGSTARTSPGVSTKCVNPPPGVVCDNSSPQIGRTGEWQDTFDIYMKDGQVCAHRTDRPTSWGLELVLQCRRGDNVKEVTFTDVIIGNTLDTKLNEKCVADPGNVICDNSAEQVGRDGRWMDKFNIYHSQDGKICAHRTDHDGPWGLNLVLRCKNKV